MACTLTLSLPRYGSVVASHLLSKPQTEQKIGPVIFVDPVSFLLHLPDVAYNFVSFVDIFVGCLADPDLDLSQAKPA